MPSRQRGLHTSTLFPNININNTINVHNIFVVVSRIKWPQQCTYYYKIWSLIDHFLFLFMWFQLNKVIVSDDCTSTRKCVRRDGESVFEDLGVNERCHPSGMCGLKDGVRQCVCKDGYIGDGVNECKSKYSLLLISVSDIIKVRIRYILSLFFRTVWWEISLSQER